MVFGKKTLGFAAIALALSCGAARAQRAPDNYDESKVGSYTLPDPLVFNDGKPVRSAQDWTARRRDEILELFQANMHGHSPPRPKDLSYEVFDTDEHALDGKAIRKQVTIFFSSKKDGPKEDLLIYLPAGTKKPAPVILSLNFSGNQAVANDPARPRWQHLTPEVQQPLFALLSRMIQQNLPARDAVAAREVSNECH